MAYYGPAFESVPLLLSSLVSVSATVFSFHHYLKIPYNSMYLSLRISSPNRPRVLTRSSRAGLLPALGFSFEIRCALLPGHV